MQHFGRFSNTVILVSFWKLDVCIQTVFPDSSILVEQKLVWNAKIKKSLIWSFKEFSNNVWATKMLVWVRIATEKWMENVLQSQAGVINESWVLIQNA